jgi:CheY-like chemotaxis protein
MKLYLPRHSGHEEAAASDVERLEAPVRSRSGEKVLVVEDDAMVRRFSVEALSEAGYEVGGGGGRCNGPRDVGSTSRRGLLFTDVVLAGPMNGRRLADAALARRPGLKVLFTTGYTRNAIIHQGRLDPGVQLLTKPFTARELTRKIQAVLGT